MKNIKLTNGDKTVTFAAVDGGYRPEWFRAGDRPMLRFKDHEWLNIGGVRVTCGQLLEKGDGFLLFGGRELFGGTEVDWRVKVSIPEDGKSGFTVYTQMLPTVEAVEVLEAMTAYELPYEYDGNEHSMTMICQQPVYRSEGEKQINGAGFTQPLWYYGRPGRAHLTYQSASPLLVNRISTPDGENTRCTMLIGDWDICSSKDIYCQPTRKLNDKPADIPFADDKLQTKAGMRGIKFLMGAINWNNSLHKDPNVVVDAGSGITQQVTVDFCGEFPDNHWDGWLADGWERMCQIHFPKDGIVGAFEVAKSCNASWIEAAQWLSNNCADPAGYPGFLNPEVGPVVYSIGTRPKWDNGSSFFAGQFCGPLAFLGHVWNDKSIIGASDRMAKLFEKDKAHDPTSIWTIGLTPFYVSMLRKAQVSGLHPELHEKMKEVIKIRTNAIMNVTGPRIPDAGVSAWEAISNLIAADVFGEDIFENNAKELLSKVNGKLEGDFWTLNCSIEGDLVGAGQARPFGHASAVTANWLAWKRFKEPQYLENAKRFANLFLGMHCITWNESESPDLDTRGWCHGSTGGRDQLAQIPPWETGFSMEQIALLLLEDSPREGIMDVLWLFAHTGLAQFPKARTLKRLYKPDMSITYRSMDSLPTEREFYMKLPYLAYENPWDQTMLAGYQGVEALQLSLLLGGGLAACSDERILAVVPQVVAYDKLVAKRFTVYLWNPLDIPVETTLCANVAKYRGEHWACEGAVKGYFGPKQIESEKFIVPSRKLVACEFVKK
ncbi:MAG: hypothetical protein WCO98_05140 [bacterium]